MEPTNTAAPEAPASASTEAVAGTDPVFDAALASAEAQLFDGSQDAGESHPSADDSMAEISKSIIDEAIAEGSLVPPVEGAEWDGSAQRWRKDGRFVGEAKTQDETGAEQAAVVAAEGAGSPAAGETAAGEGASTPDGNEAPKKPHTTFALFNEKGETVDPAALGIREIEFTANGKTRRESLDKVVRLAQYGFYNEGLQQEVEQTKGLLPAKEAQIAQLEAEKQELLGYYEQMLTDDDFVDAAREKYARLNSPEARAERAERKLREVEESKQVQQHTAVVQQYLETELQPALAAILDAHPTVTFDELYGRFTMLTDPLRVNGVIPAQSIPNVNRAIVDQLLPYVGQLHTTRAEAKQADEARIRGELTAAQQKAEAEAKAAREAAAKAEQAAHNRVARAIGPAGRASPDAPRPRPVESAEDAMDSILAGLRGGV